MKVEYVWNFPSRIRDIDVTPRPSEVGWGRDEDSSSEIKTTSKESNQVS